MQPEQQNCTMDVDCGSGGTGGFVPCGPGSPWPDRIASLQKGDLFIQEDLDFDLSQRAMRPGLQKMMEHQAMHGQSAAVQPQGGQLAVQPQGGQLAMQPQGQFTLTAEAGAVAMHSQTGRNATLGAQLASFQAKSGAGGVAFVQQVCHASQVLMQDMGKCSVGENANAVACNNIQRIEDAYTRDLQEKMEDRAFFKRQWMNGEISHEEFQESMQRLDTAPKAVTHAVEVNGKVTDQFKKDHAAQMHRIHEQYAQGLQLGTAQYATVLQGASMHAQQFANNLGVLHKSALAADQAAQASDRQTHIEQKRQMNQNLRLDQEAALDARRAQYALNGEEMMARQNGELAALQHQHRQAQELQQENLRMQQVKTEAFRKGQQLYALAKQTHKADFEEAQMTNPFKSVQQVPPSLIVDTGRVVPGVILVDGSPYK